MGSFLIYLSPGFFISYIIPILGLSLFFHLLIAFKKPYLTIKDHLLTYGTIYKTVIDLGQLGGSKILDRIISLKPKTKATPSECIR